MKQAAIIFDMDGVLIDDIPYNFELWRTLLEQYKINLKKADFQSILGRPIKDVFPVYEKKFSTKFDTIDLIKKIRHAQNIQYKHHNLLMSENLPVILEKLKNQNIQLAVATGSSLQTVNLLLQNAGIIQFFDVIITEEAVKRNKPAPDCYIAAASQLGLEPTQCVVIEDAQIGIESAHRANMKVIGYINGFNSSGDVETADFTIDNFSALTSAVIHELIANA
jgi:HAD superfamily hydrolase (TIGR01509 family)